MAFTKPNVNSVWANAGDIISPAGAKINQGWIAEIPDYEFENWIQNRQDQFNAHVNQYGIVVWDSSTEYQANKSYVQGSDGEIYRAKQTHFNQNPVNDTTNTYWQRAFDSFGYAYSKSESNGRFLQRSNNLSDVASTASARGNLSVYSKTESDSRYLNESSNLSDLDNAATARSNLGVYSTSETYSTSQADARFLNESSNLSDLDSVAAARSNLSVYSKNEADNKYQTFSELVGMVAPFPSEVVKQGWLACEGQAVSRSQYQALYNYLGTAYGNGDGSTTFNLPDYRNEFLRGASNTRSVGNKESDELKSHKHTGSTSTNGEHSHGGVPQRRSDTDRGANSSTFSVDTTSSTYPAGAHSHTFTTDATGSSETRPRNVAVKWCIKY